MLRSFLRPRWRTIALIMIGLGFAIYLAVIIVNASQEAGASLDKLERERTPAPVVTMTTPAAPTRR